MLARPSLWRLSAATTAFLLAFAAVPARADQAPSSAVRITVLDRAGAPVPGTDVLLVNPDTGGSPEVITDDAGHGVLTLPNGHWSALVRVVTPPAPGRRETITMVVDPDFVVSGDRTLVLDARAGRRVMPPVVQGQSTNVTAFTMIVSRTDAGVVGWQHRMDASVEQVRAGDVYITPAAKASTGVLETVGLWRLEPTGHRGRSTPDSYRVFDIQAGVSAGPKILSIGELHRMARIVHHYHASSAGAIWLQTTAMTRYNPGDSMFWRQVESGSTETELVTSDPRATYQECASLPNEAALLLCGSAPRSYRSGERVELFEGRGLHADLVPAQTYQVRGGFVLTTGLSDGELAGRVDDHSLDAVRTTLYRNAEQIATGKTASGFFQVPDERADFRIVSRIGRHEGTIRSDTMTEWTFSSAAPDDDAQYSRVPPALTVAYAPDVDGSGTASRRHDLRLDLQVRHFDGSASTAQIGVPVVSWTNDDGQSWQAARVHTGHDGGYSVTVPAKELRGAAAVGVRVRVADSDGSAVDQTQYGLVELR
ncbi:carboxypeptidase regulatory-like domain-containing protein [Kribbella capetownensis]|uniref:Carboxypeptidase regulatory-like domain-containing protein n=1 Tax=Kribbella capetownensis TaxID=1572659 RepID=A0A4V2M6T9_9ACTN|nr:carboxypeptidase-like regulatory domain-containing protein [Kribbella capetownensis]TCC45042.1 carboxypeptidase regulatory-like domain-containing protein [Kribbella capetownensis]